MTSEYVRKNREKNFDSIVENLRLYLVDDNVDNPLCVSYLLGRLHRILGDIFDSEIVVAKDCVRMLDRVVRSFKGGYFLYLEGSSISDRGIDEHCATDLITILLRRFNRYKREEILREIEDKLDRMDEENAYLRRMEEEGLR